MDEESPAPNVEGELYSYLLHFGVPRHTKVRSAAVFCRTFENSVRDNRFSFFLFFFSQELNGWRLFAE